MTPQPPWDWEFRDHDDAVPDRPLSPAFPSRFDAEAWLGESWRRLAEQGVATARLTHHGRPVDAPLPLRRP